MQTYRQYVQKFKHIQYRVVNIYTKPQKKREIKKPIRDKKTYK